MSENLRGVSFDSDCSNTAIYKSACTSRISDLSRHFPVDAHFIVHFATSFDNYISDLEDGEILTAVKLEPRTSEDSDIQDCRTAAISRRASKRFSSSTEACHNLRRVSNDGRRRGVNYDDDDDDGSGAKVPSSGSTPVARNSKRRRSSKDTANPGQPGLLLKVKKAKVCDIYIPPLTGKPRPAAVYS